MVAIPFKIEFRSGANLVDLTASTNVSALQEVRIGQAALPIGKRRLTAVETQMMSEEYQALKSIQALAGIQERHVHNCHLPFLHSCQEIRLNTARISSPFPSLSQNR